MKKVDKDLVLAVVITFTAAVVGFLFGVLFNTNSP